MCLVDEKENQEKEGKYLVQDPLTVGNREKENKTVENILSLKEERQNGE